MTHLHIYGHYAWHDPVRIIGEREALTRLRDALTRLVDGANAGLTQITLGGLFVNDGEGYQVVLEQTEDIDQYCVPYIDPIAWEQSPAYPRRERVV